MLFPKISSIEDKFGYSSSWGNEWRHKRRICSSDYFDKYFILGTPIHDISDEEMRLFTSMASDAEGFSKKLIEYFDQGTGRRLLEKMEDCITSVDGDSIESVIVSIFNAEDKIVGERRSMMMMDSSIIAARIIYLLLLERIHESEKRKQIIINAIEKCEKVFLPLEFVSLLTPRDYKEEEEEEGSPKVLLEFSPSDLKDIQSICLNKIKRFVEADKLSKVPHLNYVLYRWREWENEETVKTYVDELISTDEGLWEFLIGFTQEVLSTAGDYPMISQKSIREFADFESAEKRIQDIVAEQLVSLTDEQKEAVEALKNSRRKDF